MTKKQHGVLSNKFLQAFVDHGTLNLKSLISDYTPSCKDQAVRDLFTEDVVYRKFRSYVKSCKVTWPRCCSSSFFEKLCRYILTVPLSYITSGSHWVIYSNNYLSSVFPVEDASSQPNAGRIFHGTNSEEISQYNLMKALFKKTA